MKYEQYSALIEQLEKFAKENPKGYEFRVMTLAVLGYAYFIGLILLFLVFPLVIIGALFLMPQLIWVVVKVAGKLIVLIAIGIASIFGVIWNFIKSFWVTIPAPEGLELKREDAPKLFEKVEEICDFLKAKKPHHILLIEDFNAAVMTLPRWGIFGKKIYLLMGLPLMQAISKEQLESVLAHEIGHISEKHNSYGMWIYRVKETWGRFIQAQEMQGQNLSFLYAKFLNWYFPYFNAYSFVLCRRHEREADEYAVQLAGAKPLGEALINLEVKTRNLSQKFWVDLFNEAAREKTPPKEVYTQMALAFRETNKPQDLLNLSKAVAINTDYSDSHPSLAERLKNIGYWKDSDLPDLPEEVTETSSGYFLGPLEQKYSNIFNDLWQERVKEQWQARHDYLLESQKRIDEIDEKAKTGTLSADEMYEKAGLVADKYGEKESLEILLELLKEYPENANANNAVGNILLGQDNEEGIEYIHKAVKFDRTLTLSAWETIYYFLRSKGRDEEAKNYILAIENEEEIIGLAQQERSGISPNDTFDKHTLTDEFVAQIIEKVRYYDEVEALYLVRKVVTHYESVPLNVLFIEKKSGGWMKNKYGTLNSDELLQTIVERMSNIPINYFVILEKDFKNLTPRLESKEGAKIFQR